MSVLLDTRLISLHSQHTIQRCDLLKIYELSTAEATVKNIENYSFDNFLGLAIHLFVTTQSKHTRKQLSALLPKFGSAIVSPLLKILYCMPLQHSVYPLAQQCITAMDLYPLIIGLDNVLKYETNELLQKAAIQRLMGIIRENEPSILLALPKLVSQDTWNLLKAQLLEESPYPRFNSLKSKHRADMQLDISPVYDSQESSNDKTQLSLCNNQ